MSLIRLRLRTAAVAALLGDPARPPTMAGPLVFDSKMDPLSADDGEVLLPAIIVYTDQTENKYPSTAAGGARFGGAETKLIIDLAVGSVSKDNGSLLIASTDPEIEAMLDVFEFEVWRALTDPFAPTSKPFLDLAKAVPEYTSVPGRAADQATRVAMRQITITVRTAVDCGVFATTAPVVPAPAASLFGGVPYLAGLEARLAGTPEFALVAERLRAAVTGTPTIGLDRLDRIAAGFYTAAPDPDTGALTPAKGSRVNVKWKP